MRFDIVIGNPPYSDDVTHGNGGGNAIYQKFMDFASKVSIKHSLIVPSGWMMQYPSGANHELIDRFRQSKHITELHDFEDASKIFNNVSIPVGVCYYLYDSTKEVKNCKHIIMYNNGDIKVIDNQPLYNEDAEVIFRDPAIIDINSKIRAIEGDNFKSFADTCAGSKHYFDDGKGVMGTNWTGYSNTQTETYNIMYFLKSNNKVHKYNCKEYKNSGINNLGYGWVNKEQIPRNTDDYKKPKIIVGQVFNAGSQQVMDIPQYVGTNSVCSQSYIPIFSPNNTEEECLNICKYIKTRFFRYLVNALKIGHNLPGRVYKLIPTLNFYDNSPDIDWSQSIDDIDEQLYKRYGIEEYAEYIKKIISSMK